jgi:hypothetical protein
VSSIAVLGRHQRHVENIVSGEFYANGVGHLRVLTRTRSNEWKRRCLCDGRRLGPH